MTIARVALDIPLRRLFDYLIPLDLQGQVQTGIRVKVPFGKKQLIGIVVELSEQSEFAFDKLKPVLEVLDSERLFDQYSWAIKQWLVNYYVSPPGEVYLNLLPKKLREGAVAQLVEEQAWSVQQDRTQISNQAKRQLALYDHIKAHQPITDGQIALAGFDRSLLKKLKDSNLISAQDVSEVSHSPNIEYQSADYPLTAEQQTAIDTIDDKLNQFSPTLLEGVTGSGKTEVYLQIIEQVLKADKQALVLVPEIGLTPQTLSRFEQRFNTQIVTLHSELNDTERHNAWLKARSGRARIVIGTRSSILVPMPDLGLIILDEEHDASFKQQDGFRYNARDVALKRAHLQQIPVILGSATPALETLNNALTGKYQHIKLTQRVSQKAPPKPFALDITNQPMEHGLSFGVLQSIEKHLAKGNQVLVFLNRRGFSPALICHECGWIYNCHRCEKHFTFHKALNQVNCHHCGEIARPPRQCHDCGSTQIVDWGVGTEKLEEWLKTRFSDHAILRIDRDSVRRKGELARKLKDINDGKYQLLIGTQMLAKGHHFPNLTLTVIVDLDSALYSSDFRAVERMSQLLIQVAGRAGRGDKPGQVILQTHFPDHQQLNTLIQSGYPALQQDMLAERKMLRLPPYQFWAILRVDAIHLPPINQFCQQIQQILEPVLKQQYPQVNLLPAMPAAQEKRAGRWRYLMIFEASERAALNQVLHITALTIEQNSLASKVRWSLDVDPQEVT